MCFLIKFYVFFIISFSPIWAPLVRTAVVYELVVNFLENGRPIG